HENSIFTDKFRTMILLSENATMSMLSINYTKLDSSAMNPTSKLFTSLIAYISGKDVDLHHSVNSFFDDIFPEIYQKLIKARVKEVNADYVDCLREAQKDIAAFGNIPHQLSAQLDKSFDAARTILKSIQLAIEIMNQTLNFQFAEQCTNAFVRMTYCAACKGLADVKPCNGLCLNVARGCVAQLAELDKPWNDFISAFERLSTGIIGYHNAENVLASIELKILDAIKYAIDNSVEITKKVKIACGHPKRYSREATTTDASQRNDVAPRSSLPLSSLSTSSSSSASSSLYIRLQTFVFQLAESKGFFTNLGDNLCHDETLSSATEVNCWNGHEIGEYTKSIAGIGIHQMNSEFSHSSSDVRLEVSSLIDKLKRAKDILRSKAKSVPESDSYIMNDGSGSGSFKYNIISDDEDYSNLSGSGDNKIDSDVVTNPGFDFDNNNLPNLGPAGKKNPVDSGAVVIKASSLLSLLVSILSVIINVNRKL
ncbi:Glypican-5-like protein, partial [Dinothrombium tinctorium]